MIYQVEILRIDEPIEGEIMLQAGNAKLVCFSYNHPYGIEVNSTYPVKLNLLVLNDYIVEEVPDDTEPSIIRLGDSFAYVITGRLNDRCLESGELTFEDDALLSDFGYLDGKMVTMKVDRIDADFDPT
jgi:hypothetical protein